LWLPSLCLFFFFFFVFASFPFSRYFIFLVFLIAPIVSSDVRPVPALFSSPVTRRVRAEDVSSFSNGFFTCRPAQGRRAPSDFVPRTGASDSSYCLFSFFSARQTLPRLSVLFVHTAQYGAVSLSCSIMSPATALNDVCFLRVFHLFSIRRRRGFPGFFFVALVFR